MLSWQQRHRVLVSRLALLFAATAMVAVVGTAATYFLERHARETEFKTVFDAFYFTTVHGSPERSLGST
jgi:hypothetical protein